MSSDIADLEDVLDDPEGGSVQPRPPARTWRTRADYAAVALITVGVLVAALVVWLNSDARGTTSVTGSSSVPELPPVNALPPSLAEVWRMPSDSTQTPVVVDSTVVTGNGGEVAGRDPLTGESRWSYTRDLQLCTVSTAWGRAIAAYRKEDNCSEISTLDGATGERRAQRNGDAELGTRLLDEGSHVITTGSKFVEVYRRDDLVRSLEYGQLRAIVNPGKQPRTGCTFGSFAVTGGRFAVLERCPDDVDDRITVLKPNPEKADEPKVFASVVVGTHGAQVVAVTARFVAVALPNPARLVVFDAENGGQLGEYPVDVPNSDIKDPAGLVTPVTVTASHVFWHTGSRTVALNTETLAPMWTVKDTLGPGTTLAGRILIPVRTGLKVYDQQTGAEVGTIPVNRDGYTGPVQMATVGPVVLEQRGKTLVALR
ncbi:hypothetical protein Lesp02_80210 [Lentzea sp. NBRC 105346]|uniref:Rv3212 family protein n=1 Tax=Lentzea sp. NBRC 105346 TaxID=3032205 RepID=UPI0024A17810|nr:PQQ-binding-like beta-propeller repeat protein [Lentzea sp. NBRC 105346]GLZ35834.1 hypothetical protein Lesp02_80210 [Lentzea sp. NBRC 105346]